MEKFPGITNPRSQPRIVLAAVPDWYDWLFQWMSHVGWSGVASLQSQTLVTAKNPAWKMLVLSNLLYSFLSSALFPLCYFKILQDTWKFLPLKVIYILNILNLRVELFLM